jgi:hypothetical protein
MRKRLALFVGILLAGCGAAPQMLEPSLTLGAATASPDRVQMLWPSPAFGFMPSPAVGLGVGLGLELGLATTIRVAPQQLLGRSNSHLIGWCRNHVADGCPNLAGKLAAMRQLVPTWGDRRPLYRIGHGVTDGRSDYDYMQGYHFEQAWDQRGPYPYDDVRLGMEEADAMGADQLHVVNYGTSEPQEAARYVAFLNHAGDANRLLHPTPARGARMFEIGNEVAMKRERGHAEYAADEKVYGQRARAFAQAMRAASDVPIQVGAVASVNSNWEGDGWSGGADTVKNLLAAMGDQVDFLVFHGYPSWPMVREGDLQTIMAQNEWTRQKLDREIWPAIRATGRNVGIANTEFFTNLYGDGARARGMFGALYTADAVALAMDEQLLAAVEFCFSHGATADAAYFYDDDPAKPTPIYAFQRMLAQHWGDARVGARAEGLPTRRVVGAKAQVELPVLGYTAAASADGQRAYLMVVSRTNDQDVRANVDWGFPPAAVTAYTLAGARGWDSATAEVSSQPAGAAVTFPHASITILEARR